MTQEQLRKQDADKLYAKYVKPLERDHRGQYVTVNRFGATLLAPTLLEAIEKADTIFGPRQTVTFKIGSKVVGKIG
jgi:hypothetical protein